MAWTKTGKGMTPPAGPVHQCVVIGVGIIIQRTTNNRVIIRSEAVVQLLIEQIGFIIQEDDGQCCIFIFLIIWPFHIYANSTVHLLLPSRRKCKKNDTTIIILVIIQQGFFALSLLPPPCRHSIIKSALTITYQGKYAGRLLFPNQSANPFQPESLHVTQGAWDVWRSFRA